MIHKDKNGQKLHVGDRVHYFGWHDMSPTGVIVGFCSPHGSDTIALVRNVNTRNLDTILLQRSPEDLVKIV